MHLFVKKYSKIKIFLQFKITVCLFNTKRHLFEIEIFYLCEIEML